MLNLAFLFLPYHFLELLDSLGHIQKHLIISLSLLKNPYKSF